MPNDSQGELPEFASRLVNPIPGDSPVGEDPKYAGEYEAVKAEVAKTSERNWELVYDNSVVVLTKLAKDITVLGYLMQAAALHKGWAAAAEVARSYAYLLTEHWDAIHPQRERARFNALKWLAEDRVVGSFEQIEAQDSDREAVESTVKALTAVNDLVREKFADSPPSIKPLVKALEEKAKGLRMAEAPEPAPVTAQEPAQEAPTPDPVAPPPVSSAPALDLSKASKADLTRSLQALALQLLAVEPEGALGFKLLRANRWQDIVSAPRNEKGVTPFPAPNKVRATALEGLCTQKSWNDILSRSEAAFTEPGFQFWFDLQSYVVQALEGRGLTACAEAVKGELKALLKRVPSLVDMKFADSTPFAGPATREWLEELCREGGAAPASSAAVRDISLEEDVVKATALASGGKLGEALELLQSGLLYGSLRDRTCRQLEIARLALLNGRPRLSLSVGASLVDLVSEHRLLEWEPLLGASIVELQLKALTAAIDAGLAPVDEWSAARQSLMERFATGCPSVFSRIEF